MPHVYVWGTRTTTADTQLKKLVYLYLINYAKSNPDLTILAVNTFVKVRASGSGDQECSRSMLC